MRCEDTASSTRSLQSKKFDPEGLYIREYVPELAMVPTKWIHEPHLMPHDEQVSIGCRIGTEYPFPGGGSQSGPEGVLGARKAAGDQMTTTVFGSVSAAVSSETKSGSTGDISGTIF